jgi:hypothetical protein
MEALYTPSVKVSFNNDPEVHDGTLYLLHGVRTSQH